MIAFRDNLPLVRFDDGRVIHFEPQWLSRAVATAASRAGYERWWLTEHVTESVASFLKHDFGDPVVGVSRLQTAVLSVLQVIGYPDVATHFQTPEPPARIALKSVAARAGAGYELAFFGLLRDEIREIRAARPSRIEFTGLQASVRILRNAKIWSPGCSELLAEIVRFVHEEIASAAETDLEVQLS